MRPLIKTMFPLLAAVILAGCALRLLGSDNPSAGPVSNGDDTRPGELIARVMSNADVNAVAAAVKGTLLRAGDGYVRMKLPPGVDVQAAIATLAARDDIIYAEPVYVYRPPVEGRPAGTVFRDMRDDQWGPRTINADSLWNNIDTSNIIVAIVDTGIDTDNPEFAGRIKAWRNCLLNEDPNDVEDDEGHGTHVAGIIGAAHSTDAQDFKGIAKDVQFIVAKVLGPNGGTSEEVATGIRWAADQNADIINLSLGGKGYSQVIQDAIDYAVGKGIVVVAAMGNDYAYSVTQYPAACDGVIAVGASLPNGEKAQFSSEGPHISVSAPGVDIISTIPGPSYAVWSGTSMAAPHVTGVVALLLGKLQAPPVERPTLVRSILERTATGTTWSPKLGYGVIDAQAACQDNGSNVYGGIKIRLSKSSQPVAGARVRVHTSADVSVASSITNESGEVFFHFLKTDGTYNISIRGDGVSWDSDPDPDFPISVTPGTTLEIPVEL